MRNSVYFFRTLKNALPPLFTQTSGDFLKLISLPYVCTTKERIPAIKTSYAMESYSN